MATFKLKCVGCKMIEERPAEECTSEALQGDVPYCKECYMPMVVLSVIYHTGKKPKGPRTKVTRA